MGHHRSTREDALVQDIVWSDAADEIEDAIVEFLCDPEDPHTLVMAGKSNGSVLNCILRPVRRMETHHIRAQLKYLSQKSSAFYGYGWAIGPNLRAELNRRCGEDFEDTPWNEDEDNQHTTEGNTGMNLKNMAALIREDITTIKVEHDETRKTYVYLCTRQLAQKVKSYMQEEGTAQVLVKNSRGTTLGDVVEVHDDPQVDLDYKGQYRYAFALVDSSEVDQLEKEDAAIVDRLQQQKKRSVRDQVLAQLGIESPSQFLADLRHEVSDK